MPLFLHQPHHHQVASACEDQRHDQHGPGLPLSTWSGAIPSAGQGTPATHLPAQRQTRCHARPLMRTIGMPRAQRLRGRGWARWPWNSGVSRMSSGRSARHGSLSITSVIRPGRRLTPRSWWKDYTASGIEWGDEADGSIRPRPEALSSLVTCVAHDLVPSAPERFRPFQEDVGVARPARGADRGALLHLPPESCQGNFLGEAFQIHTRCSTFLHAPALLRPGRTP